MFRGTCLGTSLAADFPGTVLKISPEKSLGIPWDTFGRYLQKNERCISQKTFWLFFWWVIALKQLLQEYVCSERCPKIFVRYIYIYHIYFPKYWFNHCLLGGIHFTKQDICCSFGKHHPNDFFKDILGRYHSMCQILHKNAFFVRKLSWRPANITKHIPKTLVKHLFVIFCKHIFLLHKTNILQTCGHKQTEWLSKQLVSCNACISVYIVWLPFKQSGCFSVTSLTALVFQT